MSDDEDGPPMLVSSENVGDAEEANLNAESVDAQIKKVPISIITGQFSLHFTCSSIAIATFLYFIILAPRGVCLRCPYRPRACSFVVLRYTYRGVPGI